MMSAAMWWWFIEPLVSYFLDYLYLFMYFMSTSLGNLCPQPHPEYFHKLEQFYNSFKISNLNTPNLDCTPLLSTFFLPLPTFFFYLILFFFPTISTSLHTFLHFIICSIISVLFFFFYSKTRTLPTPCHYHPTPKVFIPCFPFNSEYLKTVKSLGENVKTVFSNSATHYCHTTILLGACSPFSLSFQSIECLSDSSSHSTSSYLIHSTCPCLLIMKPALIFILLCMSLPSIFKQGIQNEFWRSRLSLSKAGTRTFMCST